MIRAPGCPCDTGPEVCCDTLFLKADRIRTVAWNAVLDCGEDGCCTDRVANTYTMLGPQTVDPFGESVIVTWLRTTPADVTRGGHTPQIAADRAEFKVEVRSAGWPTAKGSGTEIVLPTAEQYNSATKQVMGHAELAYKAVKYAIQANTLFASTPGVIFKGTRISDLSPMQPRTYIAGAVFGVAVDLTL